MGSLVPNKSCHLCGSNGCGFLFRFPKQQYVLVTWEDILQIPENKRKKPEKKKTKIVCETCGVEVVCKAKLIEHMYLHTGERPHKCELAGCDKAFRTKSELKT